MIDLYTSNGFVRIWSLVEGQPRCLEDAIPPTDPRAPAALGRSAVIDATLVDALLEKPETEAGTALAEYRLVSTPASVEVVEPVEGEEPAVREPPAEVDPAYLAALLAIVDAAIEAATPAQPITPVPDSISDRQFFQALAISGLITKDEAIRAVSIGEMPATIAATVGLMPDDYAFDARMFFSGAYTFERHHPFTEMFAAMSGFTSDQADDLFRLADKL